MMLACMLLFAPAIADEDAMRPTLPEANELTRVYNAEGQVGLTNGAGQMIFPYYEHSYQVDRIMSDVFRVITWQNNMEVCALYNARTNVRTEFIYRQAYGGDEEDGFILVLGINEPFGYVDQAFHLVIPCQYFDAEPFAEGLAWAETDEGDMGYIDQSGRYVICPDRSAWTVSYRFSEGLAVVYSMDTKMNGYIDKAGALVVPMRYEQAGDFHQGLAAVGDSSGFYFIDKNGKPWNDLRWEYTTEFSNGYARVVSDQRWGYIDRNGTLTVPCAYEIAYPASEDGTALVSKGGGQFILIHVATGEPLPDAYDQYGTREANDGGQ